MKGEILKSKLKRSGISVAELANALGVKPQTVYASFNSKDIYSGTLEKIVEAIGTDMSFFYPPQEPNATAVASGTGCVAAIQSTVTQCDDMPALIERLKLQEKLLEEKERLIQILIKNYPDISCP